MKCCHLLAALLLAACGLDTGALPATDAGVDAAAHSGGLAGSPATWPARRRLTPIAKNKDGGAADPKDPANKPGGKQPSTSGTGGQQAKPTGQAGSAGAGAAGAAGATGATNPNGQGQAPSKGGKGSQAKPSGQPGSGTSQPSGGNNGSQSSADAGASSGGSSNGPGSNGSHGNQGNGSNGHPGNGGQGPGSSGSGNGPQSSSPVDNTVSGIVDLVLAILDLSLGPVRPAEIEQLVSAILVLSLAPAELAADSLIAVLDALDGTHICRDDPDRCNPLCENLESDCSVCGQDEDCIDRVEEMCHVKLPRRCH